MTDSDADSIVEDIEAIMDRDDLSEISANGRALIEDEYSFEAAVKRYREILLALEDN
jgi:glycosyltransferase involved in cell wall biosynthesis